MKAVCILILSLRFFGCSDITNLNNGIYEVQKQAILESPYKSAAGYLGYIEAQKEFRITQLPKLIRNKIFASESSEDTVFLIETFDHVCLGCPSERMKILFEDSVYSIDTEILGHRGGFNYRVETELFQPSPKDFQYELRNSELIEVVGKIRNRQPWKTNPLQYGSDSCNDGDHTIITVIYPDKRMEALYVRCWTSAS